MLTVELDLPESHLEMGDVVFAELHGRGLGNNKFAVRQRAHAHLPDYVDLFITEASGSLGETLHH